MAIYRGAGGAGDATADAASEALLIAESVTAAQTSATNAATSATSASTSATSASTSATNAATSATNASNSASSASTYATNASNNASTATTQASAASTSATNAATSASAASTSASSASTYASNAASSASSASTSASNAATAQTAAEAARDATLAAYDNFDDRYLGSKTSDPTLDNDGNALAAGSLYFNSVSGAMKVYTGSAWVAAYVSGAGYLASANNLSDLASASTARTNLGLAIGSNVQAWDADLDAIAAIAGTSGLLKKTAANTWSLDTTAYTTNLGTVTSVSALTLGTTGTDVSSTVATGTTTPVITLNIPTSSATARGALSSTDWSTFNSKQSALVSGTTIKTVNGTTLLGSGDVGVGVTSITGTAPIVSSGGATPAISISAATTLAAGSMSAADKSKLDGIASGATANTGTVTSIVAGTGLSGGTITTSGTIALANTTVSAGSYTSANITVDAQGRLTSASSGSSVNSSQLCKAWVYFNGTGGASIQGSYNVSSVTYNAGGDYTVNFTNAMGNTTYAAVLGGGDGSAQRHTAVLNTGIASGSIRVKTWYTIYAGSGQDAAYVTVAIFSN